MVEVIIAVTLFIIVVAISLGSIVNLLDSNRRARGNKEVMDNLNASIEYMARTVRFGERYHCGSGGTLTIVQNCTTGSDLLAVLFETNTLVYRLNASRIEFSENGGSTYKPLTASNVIIDRLQFYVFGTAKTDNIQPYVLAIIRGRVANDPQGSAVFDVQTVMLQRKIDLNI